LQWFFFRLFLTSKKYKIY